MTRGDLHVSQSKCSVCVVSPNILAYKSLHIQEQTLLLIKLCAFLTKIVHSTWLDVLAIFFGGRGVGGLRGGERGHKTKRSNIRHLDRSSLVNIDQYSDLENSFLQE